MVTPRSPGSLSPIAPAPAGLAPPDGPAPSRAAASRRRTWSAVGTGVSTRSIFPPAGANGAVTPRPGRASMCRLVLAALLMAAPVTAVAQASSGADQVVEGAKKVGKGVEETAKGIGKTITEGARDVGRRGKGAAGESKPVGDRLHDSAKNFGEALWDGMKAVGRSVHRFVTGK